MTAQGCYVVVPWTDIVTVMFQSLCTKYFTSLLQDMMPWLN